MLELDHESREYIKRRWWHEPDWSLDAQAEHARRMALEIPSEIGTLLWFRQELMLEAELARRSQLRYERANAPWRIHSALNTIRGIDMLDVIAPRCGAVLSASRGMHVVLSCPFHQDKTPSLVVYRDSNSWWCFSCNRGWSPIDFVMQFDKLAFPAACEKLALEFGIELPKTPVTLRTIDE